MDKNYNILDYKNLSASELVDYQLTAMRDDKVNRFIFWGAENYELAKSYLIDYQLVKASRAGVISIPTTQIILAENGYKVLSEYNSFEEYYNWKNKIEKIKENKILSEYELSKAQMDQLAKADKRAIEAKIISIIAVAASLLAIIVTVVIFILNRGRR